MSQKNINQYQSRLNGGCHWSLRMPRGTTLTLTDLEGGANVGMLFYNPLDPLERYNAPDTLKCQHTFKLSQGHCLYSDMGRIFCSIIEDSVQWHDTVCGNLSHEQMTKKWGERSYQQYRNEWYQSGHDSFLVELAKYGLGLSDMAANVNWFSKVVVNERGDMQYVENNSQAGDKLVLRFEMDTLVLLHTCPHPLNSAKDYPRKAIGYEIAKADAVAADDLCKNSCEENKRGFMNTDIYQVGMGVGISDTETVTEGQP